MTRPWPSGRTRKIRRWSRSQSWQYLTLDGCLKGAHAISATEQRYKAVLAVIGDGRTVGEVARDWGISASAVQNDSGMGSSVSEQKRRRLGGKSPIGLQAGDSLPVGTLTFLMTDIEGS